MTPLHIVIIEASANFAPGSMSSEERAPLVSGPVPFGSSPSVANENEEEAAGGGGGGAGAPVTPASAPATPAAASPPPPPSSPFSLLWNCGAACILTSALTRSGSAAALKGMDHRVRALAVVAARSAAALALTVLARRRSPALARVPFLGSAGARPLLLARGAVSGCAIIFFFAAVERLPLADALALNFLSPIIATLLAWAVHGERPGRSGLFAAAATVAGAALVCQPEALFASSSSSSISSSSSSSLSSYRLGGIALAVLSAFCAAAGFTVLRALSRRPEGPPAALTTAAYFHLCSLLASGVPLLFEGAAAFAKNERLPGIGEPGAGRPRLPTDLFLVAILILGGFAGQTLMNRAFLLEPAARMAALNTAQVLYGHVFGLVFLGERESVAGAAGSALIVAGAVAAALGKGGGGGGGGASAAAERKQGGESDRNSKPPKADVELASGTATARPSPLRAAA